MKHHTLRTVTTNEILFEGYFESNQHCLETAVKSGVNLTHVNLRHQQLSNANLDTAYMPYADLTGANLTGTNLSESTLNSAIFENTLLYNTCLCESDLATADFQGAMFGATDIFYSKLDESSFSTLSCFTLNFKDATSMRNIRFYNSDGSVITLSSPPIVINGVANKPIIITEQKFMIGAKLYDQSQKILKISQKLNRKILGERSKKSIKAA
ncbi:MAG: pentapeptide repeat-containing protein [Micavibrio sp.]|nr:pentapeptide repeat-containing protein [Micavibrio sp.]